MAKQPKKPTFTHCKVTASKSSPRAPWRVWFATETDGKPRRIFRSFAQEADALAFAEDKDREISNHGLRFGDIPAEVRRGYDFFRDESAALLALGAEVPRFEDLVAEALKDIRSRLKLATENDLPVAEAVAEFLAYKKTRVKKRQLANLTDQLKRFSTDFGTSPISTVTTAQIDKWLSSLRSRRNPGKLKEAPLLSPLTRNHHRATLLAFFGYGAAQARLWCPRNPVADLEPETVEQTEPEAYTPEDAAAIMQAALDHQPALVPVLALGFFAGLRISEAVEIDLSKLKADADEFRVSKSKTGPRVAPLSGTCKVWLQAQPRRKGKAWTQSARKLVSEVQNLFKRLSVEPIDNGARHSFISYRCAETRDIARIADECGNSVQTIKAHYRQLVTAADAKKFFSIRPAIIGKNVVGIESGRARA